MQYMHDLRNQPFKGLYLTYQFITIALIKLPFWFLIYLPKSWRNRPTWSLQFSILNQLLRKLGEMEDRVGSLMTSTDHRAIKGGRGVQALWIDPVPDLIKGELEEWAIAANVKAVRIPGYWFSREGLEIPLGEAIQPGEKILYRLHGGAWVFLSGHPHDVSVELSRQITQHCPNVRRVFAIEYRLSTAPPLAASNPFPAAILDVLAGYDYLVNGLGFHPSDIIIEGESAGGNLALALTRYLVESHNISGNKLPAPPAGLILASPWVDLSASHETEGSSSFTLAHVDFIGKRCNGMNNYPKIAYLGPHGVVAAETNRFLSPASLYHDVSFVGFPRTFLNAGSAEVFVDQIRTLKKRMERDMGAGMGPGQITYHEGVDGVHVYPVIPFTGNLQDDFYRALAQWMSAA